MLFCRKQSVLCRHCFNVPSVLHLNFSNCTSLSCIFSSVAISYAECEEMVSALLLYYIAFNQIQNVHSLVHIMLLDSCDQRTSRNTGHGSLANSEASILKPRYSSGYDRLKFSSQLVDLYMSEVLTTQLFRPLSLGKVPLACHLKEKLGIRRHYIFDLLVFF